MAPDLHRDKGRSYEMKNWEEEPVPISPETSRRSHEAILESGSDGDLQQEKGGIRKIFKKLGRRDSEADGDEMTITRTSEVELQIESISGRKSKRYSRQREPPQTQ
jgi:hypothetical protein